MDESREVMGMMEVENSGVGDHQLQHVASGDNLISEKASGQQGGGLLGLAKRGVEMLREKLKGKTLWRSSEDGKLRVKEKSMARTVEESEIRLEEIVKDGEEVTVDIEQAEDEEKEGKEGSSYSGTTAGYGFLDELGEEEKDEKLEKRKMENGKGRGGRKKLQ